MTKTHKILSLAVMMATLLNSALAHGQQKNSSPTAKRQASAAAQNNGTRANNALTAAKIGNGMVVRSLNGLTDNVTIAAGTNIKITSNGNMLMIDAPSVLSSSVAHDATLTGDGSASTPLGLAVPLFF